MRRFCQQRSVRSDLGAPDGSAPDASAPNALLRMALLRMHLLRMHLLRMALRRSLGPRASVQSPRSLVMAPAVRWRPGTSVPRKALGCPQPRIPTRGLAADVTRSAHFTALPLRNRSHGALRHAATSSSGVIFRPHRGPPDPPRATRRFTANPVRSRCCRRFSRWCLPAVARCTPGLAFVPSASGQRSLVVASAAARHSRPSGSPAICTSLGPRQQLQAHRG